MGVLINFIPGSLIRWAGRAQFRYPMFRPLIHRVGQWAVGRGVIRRGPGKGLRFDATASNPGYLAGTTEPAEQNLLAQLLKPGMVVYDLGANVGFYAVLAARFVTDSGRVYAFEPTPQLCERIRKNAALNAMDHIEVIEAAVFNRDGHLNFNVIGELSTRNRIEPGDSGKEMPVASITIDSFAATHRAPNLLLIDIEGAEIEAIQGAMKTIRQCRPTMMVEVHWLGQKFLDFVERELKPLGYNFATYDGKEPPAGDVRYHAILTPK